MSEPEEQLAFQLRAAKIGFVPQLRDNRILSPKGREYIFDFSCWKNKKTVLVEVQGGIWRKKGAHNTGVSITRDCDKHNKAVIAGYKVLMVTPDQVKSGQALQWIEQALA